MKFCLNTWICGLINFWQGNCRNIFVKHKGFVKEDKGDVIVWRKCVSRVWNYGPWFSYLLARIGNHPVQCSSNYLINFWAGWISAGTSSDHKTWTHNCSATKVTQPFKVVCSKAHRIRKLSESSVAAPSYFS